MENQESLSMVPKDVDMDTTNTSGGPGTETSAPTSLRHKSTNSGEWTIGEQCLLEELLSKYASTPKIARYGMIVKTMKNKTIRDVALRCKWMDKTEKAKLRKKQKLAKQRKDKKDKEKNSKIPSNVKLQPNGLPYQSPIMHRDIDDGISSAAIGGVAGDLFEQNVQMFDQVFKNFSTFQLASDTTAQIAENVKIFHQVRDNIQNLTNLISEMPEPVREMPPLPVKIKEETLAKISLLRDQRSFNPKK